MSRLGAIGHSKAADESRHGAVTLHPLGDDFAAAVDDDYLAALLLKTRQVLEGGVVAAEGAAANLDHDGGFRRAVGIGRGYVHFEILGGVGAVEGDVLFAEVATPGGGAVLAQVQVDPDFHLSLGHEGYDGVPVEGGGEAVFHDEGSIDVQGQLTFLYVGFAAAKGHGYAAPVWVVAVNGGLDEAGAGDDARGAAGLSGGSWRLPL